MEIKFLVYLIKHWWLLNSLMPLLTKCSTLALYTAAEDMSIQCAQNCTGWLWKRISGLCLKATGGSRTVSRQEQRHASQHSDAKHMFKMNTHKI